MSRQIGTKSGVKSTAEKTSSTRHPFTSAPSTRETEGSQSYRARTLGERTLGSEKVHEPKAWTTRRRNQRVDGSGHFNI